MWYFLIRYKINEVIKKFWIAGDKFVPEMALKL